MRQGSRKSEAAIAIELAQARDKLTAEDAAEDLHREKETVWRGDPAGVIGRNAAGRNHTVDVRVMQQLLVPGVQHAEEPDLSAEMARVARHSLQRRGAGAEQQAIDLALVLQSQRRQFTRQGKDHVDVAGR